MNYNFASTGLSDMYCNRMEARAMVCSTATPMIWSSDAWPEANIEVREPKPLERVCAWCGAMFHGSKFYPGNCICCGGPRGI